MPRHCIPSIDRFFRYVGRKQPDGCIQWTGCTDNDGYGIFDHRKAHRVSYETFVGPIPDGLSVLHRCDNPPCLCPTHLFLGTTADNMRDKASKLRVAGEKNPRAKLTERIVREIRTRHKIGGVKQTDLAKEFGTTPSTVHCIVKGQTWRHI